MTDEGIDYKQRLIRRLCVGLHLQWLLVVLSAPLHLVPADVIAAQSLPVCKDMLKT